MPFRVLRGGLRTLALIDPVDPGCHIDWALLAAIGRVESDRASRLQPDPAWVDRMAAGVTGIPARG